MFRARGTPFREIGSVSVWYYPDTSVSVFIYRPTKIVGSALEPSVFVDETELARMDNNRYFAIKVKPGKHIIRTTDDKKGYALDMGPFLVLNILIAVGV